MDNSAALQRYIILSMVIICSMYCEGGMVDSDVDMSCLFQLYKGTYCDEMKQAFQDSIQMDNNFMTGLPFTSMLDSQRRKRRDIGNELFDMNFFDVMIKQNPDIKELVCDLDRSGVDAMSKCLTGVMQKMPTCMGQNEELMQLAVPLLIDNVNQYKMRRDHHKTCHRLSDGTKRPGIDMKCVLRLYDGQYCGRMIQQFQALSGGTHWQREAFSHTDLIGIVHRQRRVRRTSDDFIPEIDMLETMTKNEPELKELVCKMDRSGIDAISDCLTGVAKGLPPCSGKYKGLMERAIPIIIDNVNPNKMMKDYEKMCGIRKIADNAKQNNLRMQNSGWQAAAMRGLTLVATCIAVITPRHL